MKCFKCATEACCKLEETAGGENDAVVVSVTKYYCREHYPVLEE